MITIVERLKEYIDYKGITVSAAERQIGVSNATLSKPFKSNTTIKTDTLEKFLFHYNDINPVWLLTGVGEMIKSDDSSHLNNKYQDYKNLSEARLEIINGLKFKIEVLEKKIGDPSAENPKLTLYDAVAEPRTELTGKKQKSI